ncbi:MAG TPA: LuxR C-terminal-related transcriptional regulator, partial [Pseudonocardiaceae bacterium]|nr:LuxR C-terminal-related transcriptional regulator [Pseudonocardiaceae bacterium]
AGLLEGLPRALVPLQGLGESAVPLLVVGVQQAAAAGSDCVFGRPAGPLGLCDEHVEAYVRAGQPHRAQRAFGVLVTEAQRTGRPTEHAIAARCRGLLYADDEQGYSAFAEALQWHERARQPFEQARSQLCFGEFLRRHRRPTEARQVLGDALSTFTRLGARVWAQRTEAELRATGIASRPRREGSTTQLTPQELQVALVVADGATNVEAAAQLFLSTKTIEFHLSNIYRKLGIRSRAQLVREVFASTSGSLGGEVRDGVSLTAR